MGMLTRFLDWVLLRFFKHYLKKYPRCDRFMCSTIIRHPLFWISKGRLKYYLLRDFGTSDYPFTCLEEYSPLDEYFFFLDESFFLDVYFRRREWIEKMIMELEFGRLSSYTPDDSYPCCGDPGDCWEPCGDLGKSEEHVRVSDYE